MVAKKTGGASSSSSPNSSYTTDEAEHTECLTYFYPQEGWKGEFGFDWFRTGSKPEPLEINSKGDKEAENFDNIGVYISDAPTHVYLKGKFPKGEKPTFTQSENYERGFLLRGEDIKADTESKKSTGMESDLDYTFNELKIAQFRIEQNRDVVQKYALYEDGEYFYYVTIPFTSRRKTVTFKFKKSDDCTQRFVIFYDSEGKVEELSIKAEIEYQTTDKNGEPDFGWRTEEGEFGPNKSEVLKKDVVKRLRIDKKLIERIYKNEDMVDIALTCGDKRIIESEVSCPSSEITITYADNSRTVYKYEAAQLSGVDVYQGDDLLHEYYGAQQRIIKNIKKEKVYAVDELLNNPFYNHPASIFMLDSDITVVEVSMSKPRTVKCKLEVEKTTEETNLVDLAHGDTRTLGVEVFKVTGGKAKVPRGWSGNKPDYKEVDYGGCMKLSDSQLVPLWREYIFNKFFTKKYEDKFVFYPIPTLALVKYGWRDKKRDLKNDEVRLHVQTVGKFKKINFVTEDDDVVDTANFNGSTTKAEDDIKFVAEGASSKPVRIWAKDDKDGNVVGMMNVHVFDPIHLKICFVDVSFLWRVLDDETYKRGNLINPRPESRKWTYKKDRFLEILGQAGIIFDDIDDSKSMAVEEQYFMHSHEGGLGYHSEASYSEFNIVNPEEFEAADKPEDLKDIEYFSECEKWDDTLGDYVFDYKQTADAFVDLFGTSAFRFGRQQDGSFATSSSEIDLNTFIDKRFLKFYPEYAGYVRVYVLDKCMIDSENSMMPRHITSLLSFESPNNSPVVLFRRSIEACDADKSNPLACALLRSLGLNLYSDPDSMRDGELGFQYNTTTNMMDNSEYRFTLTPKQWIIIRRNAMNLAKILQNAELEAKSKK